MSGDQGRRITTSGPVWTTEGGQGRSGQGSENLLKNRMDRKNRKVLAYQGKVLGSVPKQRTQGEVQGGRQR